MARPYIPLDDYPKNQNNEACLSHKNILPMVENAMKAAYALSGMFEAKYSPKS
jgi:hypothetical protein